MEAHYYYLCCQVAYFFCCRAIIPIPNPKMRSILAGHSLCLHPTVGCGVMVFMLMLINNTHARFLILMVPSYRPTDQATDAGPSAFGK